MSTAPSSVAAASTAGENKESEAIPELVVFMKGEVVIGVVVVVGI